MLKFTFSLALTLFATLVFAQKEMHWDTHGVGFSVPANFKEETNNAEEYTASNDNLFLSIIPIQDETLDEGDLAAAVIDMAKGLEYDVVEEVDEIELNGLYGYYVSGRKDGVNAVLMALLDAESSTNLLVVIVYNDGYFDEAVEMAGSFFAYD